VARDAEEEESILLVKVPEETLGKRGDFRPFSGDQGDLS
jgi:hypothetical protein